MKNHMNTNPFLAVAFVAALVFAVTPALSGCGPQPDADHGHEHAEGEDQAHAQEDEHGHEHAEGEDHDHAEGDDHGDEHAEGEDHDHAHAEEDDHGHEHAEGEDHDHEHAEEEMPDNVDDMMHAIAAKHTVIETADTDQALFDAHHVPFEIHEMLTKLQSMVSLSDEDGKKYTGLLGRIKQQADLIEEHAHDNDAAMVRAIVDKLNADIEAAEKLAAPDHAH